MEIDEGAKETAFAGRTPTASKKKTEVVANQPSRHREILPEENQSQGDEHSVMDAIEASRARDEIAPSLRDLAVDQQPFLDRLASPAQKSAPGITGLETALPGGLPTPSNSMNGPLREPSLFEPKRVGWLSERLNNVNRLTLSIRAVMILIMLALVFTRFYPSQHEAAVPQAKDYVENPHEAPRIAAAAKPIGNISGIDPPLQRVLASTSPGAAIPQDRDQHEMNSPKKQKIVEPGNTTKVARPEEIYRVSEASILRKRPTANSEIVDTLRPGTRILVTSRSGQYLRVRSLGGEKVSGFVHKEDAFFERATK
jgi:hypothetical protein